MVPPSQKRNRAPSSPKVVEVVTVEVEVYGVITSGKLSRGGVMRIYHNLLAPGRPKLSGVFPCLFPLG